MSKAAFERYQQACQQRINQALEQQFVALHSDFSPHPNGHLLQQLQQAINYSLLLGGKRVRPLLVYASSAAINSNVDQHAADQLACAIEMVHAYSLIHDDLPAMDDDDLRRGQASCHIAFDEATAILAGDALQARAFGLLTEIDIDAEIRLQLIRQLSAAAGATGMVGGQMIDLAATGQQIDLAQLETLHRLKTGAMIEVSVTSGATLAGATATQLQALREYASAIGLAYQVRDDILDVEGDTGVLGKQQGTDARHNKPTYASLLGVPAAKQMALELHQQAQTALQVFNQQADPLRQLASYIIDRIH